VIQNEKIISFFAFYPSGPDVTQYHLQSSLVMKKWAQFWAQWAEELLHGNPITQ